MLETKIRTHYLLRLSLVLGFSFLLGGASGQAQGASIAFVQSNFATPQTPQSKVSVPYKLVQTAGNLNVVVVGWNDSTAKVSSVVDSKGNVYSLAVGPTVQSGVATQAIYYAKNISAAAANGNTITVTFSVAANYPDIRIAEYSGLDAVNPLDVSVGAQGSSATSNSGSVATTNANDLLVGANLVQTWTTGAGTGYTSRVITTQDADILEDRVVTATGTYSATAAMGVSGAWIMQMAAFRAAGSGGTTSSITSLTPNAGPVGTSVTIAGTNFGATQGTSTVTFNGTSATPTSWSATSIVVAVPTGATTGNVVVAVGGTASNGVAFTVTTVPSITSLSPTSGLVGTSVTITGANLGATQGTSTVTFNKTSATPTSWSATRIVVAVPTGATTGSVVVTVGGVASNGVNFTITVAAPSITSLSPTSGSVGASVTVTGTNFGATPGTSTVTFNGIVGTPSLWSATSIVVPVPVGATTGSVVVTVGGVASNGVNFTITVAAPSITSLSPTSGSVGASVTVTGTNFGATPGTSTVTFNGIVGTPSLWSATSIVVPVPVGATTGSVVVTVGGVASNGVNFTITVAAPSITSLSPTSGSVGASVTVTGTNFGATPGTSTVTFNGIVGTPSLWSATSIVVPVPVGATTGNVVVTVSGAATASVVVAASETVSNGVAFTVTTAPSITSLSPTSGSVGVSVTITGTNFGATPGTSTVTFNGIVGAPSSWSATSIVASVPSGATTGNVVVTVGGTASNSVPFTVSTPASLAFVQAGYATPQSPQSTVVVPYALAQTAGNLNVVVVGWNDSTAKVGSVVDSKGNVYSLAVGPTVQTGVATLAVYYAKNIAAAAANGNIVTVTFTAAANYPDIRIAEYTGLDTVNPLDVSVAAQGNSSTSNSGTVATTNANDLLVGANLVQTGTTGPGAGYTSRVITTPDADILEDQIVTVTGNYSATAPISPSASWIMQMVAFRAAGGTGGTPPSITSLSPTSGTLGTSVTITGTNFGATQGTVKFNGTSATATSWSTTSIVAPVPAGATTGNVIVTEGGVISNSVVFTVQPDTTPPVVTMTAPASGAVVSKTVTVSANATDNVAVAKVQFQLDGANVGTAVTVAPYAYSWDTTKTTNAAHTLRAIATDTSNNSTTSASVSVTVNNSATDTTPPTVAITSPASGASVSGTVTVSGTASDNVAVSLVQVSVDNGSFSNASGTTSWSFSLNTVSLSNASHTLAAKATDSSGNTTTSSPVSITVSNSGGTGTTVTVNSTTVFQTIDGFGASSAYTGDGITNSQADLFWTTTSGVGLSLLRVQIQPDGTYPDLATMQKAQARGIKIWGTPWTPPASMKTNGSTTNGGSLIASDYQAYADYLTNYILTLKNSYGINLYALSIQNEPNYVATWESCIWTGQQFHDFLLNNLLPDFAKNGVVTKIIMPEETGWFFDLATTTLNDPATAAGVSIIAAHDYNNGAAAPYALGQNQGKGLWETEISTFGTFDPSMSDALVWGQEIHDWMTIANANAWHYWWLIGDSAGDNQGLVSQSGQVSKRLYMMGNFSKFARPGYVRIGATSSPVSGVSISAYKDPNSGTFAIVAINHNGSSVPLNFTFSGLTPTSVTPWITSATLSLAQQSSISVGGGSFSFTLPASSVTTFAGN